MFHFQDSARIGFDLLHPQTISRTSRERLQDFLSVVREARIETLAAVGKPAFGNEGIAVGEVVRRAVGGEMGDADTDLCRVFRCQLAYYRRRVGLLCEALLMLTSGGT